MAKPSPVGAKPSIFGAESQYLGTVLELYGNFQCFFCKTLNAPCHGILLSVVFVYSSRPSSEGSEDMDQTLSDAINIQVVNLVK